MAKATFDGTDARDAIERPVNFNGHYCIVLEACDQDGEVIIQAWKDGAYVGEPIRVDLAHCIPLCAHCGEPLEESADFYPGECHQDGCFLRA